MISDGCSPILCLSALQVARATFYRTLKPVSLTKRPRKYAPRNRIPENVRDKIRSVLHEIRFVDRTPWEIVPTLADEGVYLGSIRTFYRILGEMGEVKERRLLASHVKRSPPILEAQSPNVVWSWDITRIPGPVKGQYFFLYVMLDIFSRYVVGWMLGERENARRAQNFIRETVRKHLKSGEKVTIHNDRGSPMKAGTTRDLLQLLGLEQSFSRPRISDDNPYSESQFKTLKYSGGYPKFVESIPDGETYLESWFLWYNNEHRHKGLNLHTPATVHFGRVEEVVRKRQETMERAYMEYPERFSRGRPKVKSNPRRVGINLRFLPAQTINPSEINEASA